MGVTSQHSHSSGDWSGAVLEFCLPRKATATPSEKMCLFLLGTEAFLRVPLAGRRRPGPLPTPGWETHFGPPASALAWPGRKKRQGGREADTCSAQSIFPHSICNEILTRLLLYCLSFLKDWSVPVKVFLGRGTCHS